MGVGPLAQKGPRAATHQEPRPLCLGAKALGHKYVDSFGPTSILSVGSATVLRQEKLWSGMLKVGPMPQAGRNVFSEHTLRNDHVGRCLVGSPVKLKNILPSIPQDN